MNTKFNYKGEKKMEINVEIKNLTKEDIIYILSEAFKCPRWYKNNVLEVTNNLLKNECTTIIDSKNIRFAMSLNRLYKRTLHLPQHSGAW